MLIFKNGDLFGFLLSLSTFFLGDGGYFHVDLDQLNSSNVKKGNPIKADKIGDIGEALEQKTNIPIYEIGARAMKVLTNEILGAKQENNTQIRLQHSIIKRGTTK